MKDDLWLAPGDVTQTIGRYLANDKTNEKAACLRGEGAGPGTQDFATNTLQGILASVTAKNTIPLYAKNKTKGGFYNSSNPHQVTIQNWPDPEGFKKATIGSRSPDVPFYADRELRSAAYITFIKEVKGTLGMFKCGSESLCTTPFPDEEKGTVLDFMLELMERHQPLRKYTYGVLSDSRRFQFFKVARKAGDDFDVSMSSVHCGKYGTAGWKV